MEEYSVTTNLQDAAIQIINSSFALYQVPRRTAVTVQEAWLEAKKVLNHPSSNESKRWTRIVNGHLHGYNEPSPAKRLFRAFHCSPRQPWPNERFREVSTDLANDLHSILMECYKCLCRTHCSAREITKDKSVGTTHAPSKRPRLAEVEAQHCPLDYFLYHNLNPTAINCSEHVDRGILIAVCLTDVPGLEILALDSESQKIAWVCPEIHIRNTNLYREMPTTSVSDLVCIMAGKQLSQILTNEVPACVHRVRNNLMRARLSISYELRFPY